LKLAAFASKPELSRGRVHAESASASRDAFARDRDRILHSAAFRRLCYKTQVFITTEGDLFRTRLTHSLEVAQIGRAIARRLGANEDLVEAIALGHDLGHTPFGHAGQHALHECMRPYGGFEHNLQSLRVVDVLEQRYVAFDGLNLSFETREGLLKHCSKRNAHRLGELGERFLTGASPSIEAQITNLADEIAYCNHDVEDGLRAGLITVEQMLRVPLFGRLYAALQERHPSLAQGRLLAFTIRELIGDLVADLLDATRANLAREKPRTALALRAAPLVVAYSSSMQGQLLALKRFLHTELYRHPRVMHEMERGQQIIVDLFRQLQAKPTLLPPEYLSRHAVLGPRTISDYIAGMTDRYAIKIGTGSI
jgi:dGTPase